MRSLAYAGVLVAVLLALVVFVTTDDGSELADAFELEDREPQLPSVSGPEIREPLVAVPIPEQVPEAATGEQHPNVLPLPQFESETVGSEDFLQAYWGGRWPAIKAELGVDDLSLAQEIKVANIRPFEEVRDQLHAELAQEARDVLELAQMYCIPSTAKEALASPGVNPSGVQVGLAEARVVAQILDDFNPRILEAAIEHLEADAAYRKRLIAQDRYMLGPLYAVAHGPDPESMTQGASSTASWVGGWRAHLALSPDRDARFAASLQRLTELRAAKSTEIREYLESQ